MTEAETRIIAVDWSGKKGAAESIWLAEAVGGQIVQLENGVSREALVARLISIAEEYPQLIVGFDFAFSMPSWFVQQQSSTGVAGFWQVVASSGESWLKACPPPFYGFLGTKRPIDHLRRTEQTAGAAKSTFLINSPGAVGVGSIRGMPLLLKLQKAGWRIWPFDPPGFPMAVEIYPRLLAGPVIKTVWKKRMAYLEQRYPNLNPRYVERAAGSEDAFDAAVSALVMDRHVDALSALSDLSKDPVYLLEGCIWSPPPLGD